MTEPFRASLSVTPFTASLLAQGWSFTDGSRTASTLADVQRLFIEHGATEVYTRIATRRYARDNDAQHGLDAGLELAVLARDLGLPLNPELGLWAVYGDLSHQPGPDFSDVPGIDVPGPWHTLTTEQMVPAMRAYGGFVAREILATGVEVNVWDIGNEVDFGVAGVAVRNHMPSTHYWEHVNPDGVDPEIGRMHFDDLIHAPWRDEWLAEHVWPNTSALLAAVAEGIRSVDPTARVSTHTSAEAAVEPGLLEAFYAAMERGGFAADELGTSYYPSSPAEFTDQFQQFQDTVSAVRARFNKPVFLAEVAYPSGSMDERFPWNSPLPGYPINTDGAYRFIRDLVAWGAETGALSGIRPWAPDYSSGHWQSMSHFHAEGTLAIADPVLDGIAHGLAAAAKE